jgi:hypothetical protein
MGSSVTQYLSLYSFSCLVVCLIGDNCSTNKAIARLLQLPLVGCASHRHTLEMNRLCDYQPLLKKVIKTLREVMTKARTNIAAAELRNAIQEEDDKPRKPYNYNKTRWRGKYHMVARYLELKEHLRKIDCLAALLPFTSEDSIGYDSDEDVEETVLAERLVGRRCTEAEVWKAFKILVEQDIVCARLQKANLTLEEAQSNLEYAAAKIETFCVGTEGFIEYRCKYIKPTSDIVEWKDFESAVGKIQAKQAKGNQVSLSAVERQKVFRLRKAGTVTSTKRSAETLTAGSDSDGQETESPAAKVARLRKEAAQTVQLDFAQPTQAEDVHIGGVEYVNASFIQGTTNTVERCFRTAKLLLSDIRMGMSPFMFENFMFLRFNKDLWNEHTVREAMQRTKDQKRIKRDEEDTVRMFDAFAIYET